VRRTAKPDPLYPLPLPLPLPLPILPDTGKEEEFTTETRRHGASNKDPGMTTILAGRKRNRKEEGLSLFSSFLLFRGTD